MREVTLTLGGRTIKYLPEGDPDLDVPPTREQERRQADEEERDAWQKRMPDPLSYEQYAAGEPCPGCGRPYIDKEPWADKGTMYFTEEERARHDAEEKEFWELHEGHKAIRHRVSGSLTTHCGRCCPAPPLSPLREHELGRSLRGFLSTPKPDHELMVWRLRLYCGHVVERTAHYTNPSWRRALPIPLTCPECGKRGIVIASKPLHLAGEPPTPPTRKEVEQKKSKAKLRAELRDLREQIERVEHELEEDATTEERNPE